MDGLFDEILRDVELYISDQQSVVATCDPFQAIPGVAGGSVVSVVDSSLGLPSPSPIVDIGDSMGDVDILDNAADNTPLEPAAVVASAFDHSLQEAHFANARTIQSTLPWETGVFAAIFGNDDVIDSNLNICPVPPEPVVAEPAEPSIQGAVDRSVLKRPLEAAIFPSVVKNKSDVDHLESMSQLWKTALRKWHVVFSCTRFSGFVGTKIMYEVANGLDPSGTIRDVLGTKSPKTACKRASTMLSFFSWAEKQKLNVWPISSDVVSAYIADGDKTKAGCSKGKTLLEAFRFCKHVMGIGDLDDVLDNPIILGRVRRLESTRDTIKQSRPLKLSEVRALEDLLFSQANVHDRYISGCILFAIFSRSRWSDLSYLDWIALDVVETSLGLVGFVESSTKFQKTGTSALKKAMQMPLVAPIGGVTDRLWAVEWFTVLKKVGLDPDAKPFGALCRPPTGTGLGVRPITTSEIAEFLNSALSIPSEERVTSHSMKTTTLVWAARYGLDESTRTLLGHHELQSQSLACYSRDMLSRPLAEYEAMLLNIKRNNFMPDETRSGRFANRDEIRKGVRGRAAVEWTDDEADDQPIPRVDELSAFEPGVGFETVGNTDLLSEPEGLSEGQQSSSDDTDSSPSSSSSVDEEGLVQRHDANRVLDYVGPLYQHKKSKILHKPNKVDGLLQCGRHVGSAYTFLKDGASFKWARCSFCFKGQVVTSVEGMVDAFDQVRAKRA